LIYLVGQSQNDIASSEYLYSYCGVKASPAPAFDLEDEFSLQQAVGSLISSGLVQSVHDVSDGGLFIALAESALPRGLGFEVVTMDDYRKDAFLFGESQSRVVVSVSPEKQAEFQKFVGEELKTVHSLLGKVTSGGFVVDREIVISTSEAKDLYDNSLGKLMN
jgi:phosphoribosylformylglycinamidine synthase subunit PurL